LLSKLVEPEIKPQNEAIFNLRKEANKINEAITKMESSKFKSDEQAFSK
jgi:hypothetical protein